MATELQPDTEQDQADEPPATGWRRIPQNYRIGGFIIVVAIIMASLFALSYGLALARPSPHDVPIATVGAPARTAAVVKSLEAGAKGGLQIRPYGSFAQATNAVDRQRVYAIIDTRTSHPRLWLSSAAGASVSRVLQTLVQGLPPSRSVKVTDLHPLPAKDMQGLVSFYVTIAATIVGFISMFQLRANVSGVSVRGWLGLVGALAVAGGAALAFVGEFVLRALDGPFLEIWVVLAVQVAITALFNSVMLLLVGRWSILPTWAVFILLGNSSSGGAAAPPLLPPVFEFLNTYLPSGATVSALHAAVYFTGYQRPGPFVVLGIWLVVLLAGLLVLGRIRGRSPAD